MSLLKTFDLEGVYELVHHPPPLGNPVLRPYGMARLVELALGYPKLEKAHAQCIALLDELKHILENPKKFLSQLGEHYEYDYADKWAGLKEQLSQRTLIGDFEAGRITGQVLLDVIMILLTCMALWNLSQRPLGDSRATEFGERAGGAKDTLKVRQFSDGGCGSRGRRGRSRGRACRRGRRGS